MAVKEVVLELVERLLKIENELKLLQEDKKTWKLVHTFT